jgi:hypothetical protein
MERRNNLQVKGSVSDSRREMRKIMKPVKMEDCCKHEDPVAQVWALSSRREERRKILLLEVGKG